MFNFGGTSVDFLPDDDARAWVADGLAQHRSRLGAIASEPRLLETTSKPRDLDELFDVMCGIQAQVGQSEVEFSLVELGPNEKPPAEYTAVGNPEGHLMHTLVHDDEYAVIAVPQLFKVPQLLFAAVAREIARIAIHRAGAPAVDPRDVEGDTELAAVALGMGVWIANGAYIYENACCGGGCGIDLRSVRAGLSMPEACFALAVDSQQKGLSRRVALRHLEPNQKAALKSSWGYVKKQPALTAAPQAAALPG